ncbi:MAG: hypothetical protein Q9218_004419 [Villophora microphyllina]
MDPSPASNLSVAHYEMGLYSQCIDDIQTALRVARSESGALEPKLALRLIKAQLQLNRKDYRRERLSQLPKYLRALGDNTEYYVVGHDDAFPQIDSHAFGPPEKLTSSFFPDIGDARNLYATLLRIDQSEQKDLHISSRKYHLTVNDFKAETLACDVLMSFLLGEVDGIDESREGGGLTTLFFIYIVRVVSERIAERFQAALDRVINELGLGKATGGCVHVYGHDKASMIKSLQSWRGKLRSKYSVIEALRMHINHLKSTFLDYSEHVGQSAESKLWEPERRLFVQIGAYRPPKSSAQEYEPLLSDIKPTKKHT